MRVFEMNIGFNIKWALVLGEKCDKSYIQQVVLLCAVAEIRKNEYQWNFKTAKDIPLENTQRIDVMCVWNQLVVTNQAIKLQAT